MHRQNRGLTLMEILVSLVILSLVMVSLGNLFVGAKRLFLHSRSRVVGAEVGRRMMDPFQMHVRQNPSTPVANDGWGQINNWLRNVAGTWNGAALNGGNGIVYQPQYAVTNVVVTNPGTGQTETLRRVVLTIQWNEPNP